MSKQKELAMKVMGIANEFTHWNFQMEQEGNIYLVGTTLSNQKGQELTIYYLIGEEEAQLTVISPNCRYDDCNINEKVHAIPLEYPVYVVAMGNISLSLNSPMPIGVLDSQMGTIVLKRMPDMIQAMTDIVDYK